MDSTHDSTVYIVHAIDTEGPLYESTEATFDRLNNIFDIDDIQDMEWTEETLSKLQSEEIDLGGKESAVQKVIDPDVLDYNDDWGKIDRMLDDIFDPNFRRQFRDSYGNSWVCNWFCVDHVDYDINPRRRTMGYHNIFDHYQKRVQQSSEIRDDVQFHFHPHPPRKQAHQDATHWWANSDTLYEVLCRRIIDRNWFPAANRPGFHVERPDSHWFLEQYIPFDYANLATEYTEEDKQQVDVIQGRSGDWRRAPKTWEPYHPHHDDYQSRGDCRRWIARCLNVGGRRFLLSKDHIREAFTQAKEGKSVVLSFVSHDYRDIRKHIEKVHSLIESVAYESNVEYKYCRAVEAMREALDLPSQEPCDLDIELVKMEGAHVLRVSSETPTFGPQPFLAVKTHSGHYYHDNFDFQEPRHEWTYVFDERTFPISAIDTVGVAANNAFGTTTVTLLDIGLDETMTTYLNERA